MKLMEKPRSMLSGALISFRKKKRKTRRNIIISFIAFILIVSFGINYLLTAKSSGNTVTYKDVKVERRDITVTLTGNGND